MRDVHFILTLDLAMARINVNLDDELHRKVKAAAALEGLTLKDFVVTTLHRAVEDELPSGRRRPDPTEGRQG